MDRIVHNGITWEKRSQPGPVLVALRGKRSKTARGRRLLLKRSRLRTTLSYWLGSATVDPSRVEPDIKVTSTPNGGLQTCIGQSKVIDSYNLYNTTLDARL